MKRVFSLALILGLSAAQSASAATVFYDFGDSNQQTAGNYNNLVVNPPGVLSLPDSVDSTGASTGITVAMSGFYIGSNLSGPTSPSGDAGAIFAGQATRDNTFGHELPFGGNPLTPQGTVLFGGLDGSGATSYDFTIFASRQGANDIRDALYTITGATSGSGVLDASNNVSEVVTISGIIPNAQGQITLTAEKGPNNNNASRFYYLGAIRLESSPAIPEPTSLVIAGLAGMGLLIRRR